MTDDASTATQAEPEALHIFTVYNSPSDYPGQFVLRMFTVAAGNGLQPGPVIGVADTYDDVIRNIPSSADMRFRRAPTDDPCIVETWM